MKHLLLAAGAAALAVGLPATAALADGYNARPAYMQAKPKPKPVHRAKPAAKPHKQARRKPQVHVYKPHGYAAAHVRYEEFESVETSVTKEVNGHVFGQHVTYSERYVSPERGCYPQAPCGYSTGGHAHGAHHGQHQGARGHDVTIIRPGFEHGAMTGGVGYGVDGGHVYGAAPVYIVPGGRFSHGGRVTGYSSSSTSSHSSSQTHGSASYGYGVHGGTYGHGFGYGPTYGHGGSGYLGFKPGAYGYGVGQSGYGGLRR